MVETMLQSAETPTEQPRAALVSSTLAETAERSTPMAAVHGPRIGQKAPGGVVSMNETLAHGLTSRLVSEVLEPAITRFERQPRPIGTSKRPALYRGTMRWLIDALAGPALIDKIAEGDQSGCDKNASFSIMHWLPQPSRNRLLVQQITVRARDPGHVYTQIDAAATNHAVTRVFQRLKTGDQGAVLSELRACIQNGMRPIYQMEWAPDNMLVPTPHGYAIFGVDFENHRGNPASLVVKTFLPTGYIEQPHKARSIELAREERGVALEIAGYHVVISPIRVRDATPERATDMQAAVREALTTCICRQIPARHRDAVMDAIEAGQKRFYDKVAVPISAFQHQPARRITGGAQIMRM